MRGYAQRDPLTVYKLEGYNLFLEMMANIRRNTIYNVYVFQVDKVRLAASVLAMLAKLDANISRSCIHGKRWRRKALL